MSERIIERRKVKSWHGLEFEITVWDNWQAKIGFFKHPQIANFFLRRSLSKKNRCELEVLHEFGHVQTFPLILIYYLPFLNLPSFKEVLIVTVGMLLFWEILAEIYVVLKHPSYFSVYKRANVSYFLFWMVTITGAIFPFIHLY